MNSRTRALARRAWLATLVLTIITTFVTFTLRSALFSSFVARPWGVVFPILAVAGLGAIWWSHVYQHDGRSLIASGAYLAGMLTSAAFTLYPAVLPAVDPAHSLTVTNAAGPTYGLVVGLVWWIVGMLLAAVYFVLLYRLFWGKVHPVEGDIGY